MVWERLKVVSRVVVFSRPSPPYGRRGFLNDDRATGALQPARDPREGFALRVERLPAETSPATDVINTLVLFRLIPSQPFMGPDQPQRGGGLLLTAARHTIQTRVWSWSRFRQIFEPVEFEGVGRTVRH